MFHLVLACNLSLFALISYLEIKTMSLSWYNTRVNGMLDGFSYFSVGEKAEEIAVKR